MSKKMTKKVLLASTAALLSASLLTFGPVSYKVLSNTNVAAASQVDEAKSLLQGVFGEMNKHENLSASYDALIDEAKGQVNSFVLQNDLPNLYQALGSNQTDVESSLKKIFELVLTDYKSDSDKLDSMNPLLAAEIETLNTLLGTDISNEDVAAFLFEIQEEAFAQLSSSPLESENLFDELKDIAISKIDTEWSTNDSPVIEALKSIYGNDQDALEDIKSDVRQFASSLKLQLDEETVKEGAKALLFSYALYEFSQNNNAITGSKTNNGYSITSFKVRDIVLPLSAFKWEAYTGDVEYPAAYDEKEANVFIDLKNVSLPKSVTVSAYLKGFYDNDISIYSQVINIPGSSGGYVGDITDVGVITAPYNEEAVLAGVSELITSSLELDLTTNSELAAAAATIEAYLENAFTVDVTNRLTNVNGVNVLNISSSNLDPAFVSSLKSIITKVNEQTKGQFVINPVVTLKSTKAGSLEATLQASLIKALADSGVSGVKIVSEGSSVVLPLSEVNGTTKVSISSSKTAEGVNLANQQSDVVTIKVSDASGNDQYVAEQYKVSIPVRDGADVSKLTVAMIGNGSVTLVGGKYDAATKSMVFYSNIPGTFAVVENSASFNDIGGLNWASESIQRLANLGILQGKGNGQFDPNGNVTRAEFTTMLTRALNLTANPSNQNTFDDVNQSAWYYDAVNAAKAFGIINGRSETQFDPNANITREEMAAIAANALKAILKYDSSITPVDEVLAQLKDGSLVSPVHIPSVAFLTNEGLMEGHGNGQFDPKGNSTRAQSAVIIARLLELLK